MTSSTTFTGASLEEALRGGALDQPGASVALIGMVKASGKAGYIAFTRAGCDNWVELPTKMIEKAEQRGVSRCRDHSHPIFELVLNVTDSPEAKIFAALLIMSVQKQHAAPSAMNLDSAQHRFNAKPADFSSKGYGGYGATGRGDGQQQLPIAVPRKAGGFGGYGHGPGNGGLNAWGCWDSCCHRTCLASHWEAGPLGNWVEVCDLDYCDEPCTRCIWPW
jgi:hypothetical protein